MTRGLMSACVLAIGLAACSQVPDYERPGLGALAAYSTHDTRDARVDADWWTSFHSAELDRLEAQAIGGNFDLKTAIAKIAEARATAQSAGSPLVPQVSLAGTLDRQTGVSSKSTQQLALQASYELDFWGSNKAKLDSAEALAGASVFDKETVRVTLTATVADSYFQILSLKERIAESQRVAGDARRILTLIEQQKLGGTASELQVAQQRNATATFEANVPVLQLQLDQSIHALAVLVGEQPGTIVLASRSLAAFRLPGQRAGLPLALIERRPDIRAAEARLIAANFDIGVARAAFLPNLTLSGAAGVTAKSITKFFPATALTDTALSLAQPVFNNGLLQGQLDFDRARAEELVATYRKTILTSLQDVEDMLSARRRLAALASSDLVAVEAARKAQSLAEAQFKLGGADYLTVLNTQRTLFQAEDSYLQVRLQQLQAAIGLYRALGGGVIADPVRRPASFQTAATDH